jgi:NhaP-type Na+/H+ or K+/H+ antiporter
MSFSAEVFMVAFLPPIIFNEGYMMKSRFFFANFNRIIAFAFIGTFTSTMIVGGLLYLGSQNGLIGDWAGPDGLSLAECLTFGSLISATDPVSTLAIFQNLGVNLNLYYTVLGESIFNDAVGLVLFRTFGKFVGCDYTAGTVLHCAALYTHATLYCAALYTHAILCCTTLQRPSSAPSVSSSRSSSVQRLSASASAS